MSEKEIWMYQIGDLVTWLQTCQLADVQVERDVKCRGYSDNLLKWLAVRFRTKHGRKRGIRHQLGKTKEERDLALNAPPETWIVGLNAALESLYEVASCRTGHLLLIEMQDSTAAHAPVKHRSYYDGKGIFNIEFWCGKRDSSASGRQTILLTNVGEATSYPRLWETCVWGGITLDGREEDPEELDGEIRSGYGATDDSYGVPSTWNCGEFGEEMRSDYFAFQDGNGQTLLIIHRLDAATGRQIVPRTHYKERDPIGFAVKKSIYRAKLARYFGIEPR